METSLGTRGFLFADLRGYTRFVEAHGDAAGAELLSDWRALARAVIGRHDGAEIRTEGDGIYVVFESVAAAVDAALDLIEAAAAATSARPGGPLRVAVGVHAGETTATDEGPVGSAVNIAARICAKAEAGEVLVSGTVRDLVRTARPYRGTALGSHHLKGVGVPIPVYRMDAAPAGLRTRLVRKARARRRSIVLLGAAAVLSLGLAAGAWAANRPPDCLALPASTRNVVVRIDTTRSCVTQVVDVGQRPGPLVATDDALWVGDRDSWTVTRIDPATGRLLGYLGLPGAPVSLASDPSGEVDVLTYDDRTVSANALGLRHHLVFLRRGLGGVQLMQQLPGERRAQPGTDPVSQTAYTRLADASGRTWIVSPRGTVLRATHLGLVETDLGSVGASRPALIGAAGGSVWVADEQEPSLYRFEGLAPKAATVTLAGGGGSRAMAVTDEGLWLLRQDGTLTWVEATDQGQRSVTPDGVASDVVAGAGELWLLDDASRATRRIDPQTGQTRATVSVGGVPSGGVLVDHDLWITISAP